MAAQNDKAQKEYATLQPGRWLAMVRLTYGPGDPKCGGYIGGPADRRSARHRGRVLMWSGAADATLSDQLERHTETMRQEVGKMLFHFPPKCQVNCILSIPHHEKPRGSNAAERNLRTEDHVNTFASTHSAPMAAPRETSWSTLMGFILMLTGLASIWVPFSAGLIGTIFFGSLALVSGVAHWVYAWFERKDAGVLWQILIGLICFIAGVTMLLLPVNAVFALTLVLACYIAVEGVLELMFFFWLRLLPGSAWFLIDGTISLLLSILISIGWPSSSLWALGTLLGVNLLFSGVARFTLSMLRLRPAIVA